MSEYKEGEEVWVRAKVTDDCPSLAGNIFVAVGNYVAAVLPKDIMRVAPNWTANQMLDAVVDSLKNYPLGGGDSRVLAEVDRIVRGVTAPKPLDGTPILMIQKRCGDKWLNFAPSFSSKEHAISYINQLLGWEEYRLVEYTVSSVTPIEKSPK